MSIVSTVLLAALVLLGPAPVVEAVRPVEGPVVRAFDPPLHRFGPGHRGVDLAAAPGQLVRVVRSGTVTWAGPVAGRRYVTVDHGAGLSTTYGGVQPSVRVGTRVVTGQTIGTVAPARRHLDWGARVDRSGRRTYVDPLLLLAELRPRLVAPGPA